MRFSTEYETHLRVTLNFQILFSDIATTVSDIVVNRLLNLLHGLELVKT